MSNSLRILHVIPAIAVRYGGPSSMVMGLCRTQEAQGHRVEVVTSNADGDSELDVQQGTLTRYNNVWVRFFPRRYGEAFKYTANIRRWLNQQVSDFDMVHIHAVFSWSSLIAASACRQAGVPYVVRPLGSLDPWSLGRRSGLKKLLRRVSVNRMLKDAAFIHYTTALEQNAAESTGDYARGVVVPNAVDVQDQPAGDSLIDGPYLLFVGRLSPKKRLLELVEGFYAADIDPSVRLVIAGDGDPEYQRAIQSWIRDSDDPDRVTLFGWADQQQRQSLNEHALCSILISHNENYGISIVEAMAVGTPTIVNTGVYLHDTISEAGAGWVIEEGDNLVEALASAIREAVSNTNQRQLRGEAAKRLVRSRFTWETVAAQLEAQYRKYIKNAGRYDALRQKNRITAMIFTLNEEANLPHCLASLGWCDDIIVIDSGSEDRTELIANEYGASIYVNPFEGFGTQRNWAIDNTAPRHNWLLMLDADERVPFALAQELNQLATANRDGKPVAAARVARRFYLWGKWLRFSSLYPVYVVRLVHKDAVRYQDRGHAETQRVEGEVVTLRHDLIDENHKDLAAWWQRQANYANQEARYELGQSAGSLNPAELFATDPMVRRMAAKRISFRLPMRRWLYLVYGLLFKQGFRDGMPGVRFAAMRANYQGQIQTAKRSLEQ